MAADVRRRQRWTRAQSLKNDAIYRLVSAALWVALRVPRGVVRVVCRALGQLAYLVLPQERRQAARRLAASGGMAAPAGRVRAAFLQVGDTLADTIALLDRREEAARTLTLEADSRRVFADALAVGRGVVFVCAHLGSWERLAAVLAAEGFPVATVARESYDPRFTAVYEALRAPRGVRSIYRGDPGAAIRIVRELAAARAVGFLVDLPSSVASVKVPLFGEERAVAVGPARLALARRAEVLVGSAVRDAHMGSSRIRITRVPASDLEPGPSAEIELTRRLARELDARVRAWPEAWLGLFTSPERPGHRAQPDGARRGIDRLSLAEHPR